MPHSAFSIEVYFRQARIAGPCIFDALRVDAKELRTELGEQLLTAQMFATIRSSLPSPFTSATAIEWTWYPPEPYSGPRISDQAIS